ncbi:MAG TPA: glycosyltransferase [Patescibacteria group bacterium]|nr:glycosyltransferase [Patescibacteria group bacterium]
MRIALVHDYIKEYGGAEKVLETLHEMYPDAPVYTSVYLPQFLGPHKDRFANWDIRTSYLQNLPLKAKLISPFRLLSKSVFKSFDFSKYDVIISSATGAYIINDLDKKDAKLICYCHTPPRYLYGYATAREWKKNPFIRSVAHVANHFLRMQDFTAAQNVDQYIANSEEVAGRIRKFYRRDSIVVYPPVDTGIMSPLFNIPNSKFYYLAGGRLARPKHIDLIIKACMELGVPLKVFGKGFAGYGKELRLLATFSRHPELVSGIPDQVRNDNLIEFLGEVTEEKKWELYAGAKAYIFASEDEDFGIMPVESMSAGTPVIAYKSGGVKETVVDKETGLFYDELSVESLISAIKKFEKMKFAAKICQKQAEKFSKERFVKEMKRIVEKI